MAVAVEKKKAAAKPKTQSEVCGAEVNPNGAVEESILDAGSKPPDFKAGVVCQKPGGAVEVVACFSGESGPEHTAPGNEAGAPAQANAKEIAEHSKMQLQKRQRVPQKVEAGPIRKPKVQPNPQKRNKAWRGWLPNEISNRPPGGGFREHQKLPKEMYFWKLRMHFGLSWLQLGLPGLGFRLSQEAKRKRKKKVHCNQVLLRDTAWFGEAAGAVSLEEVMHWPKSAKTCFA